MSAKDHPNNAPGVPMVFPPAVHRAQVKYINPVVKKVARFLPSFAVIEHRGRKSGKPYETVVNTHRKGNTLAVILGHGKADWVRNVLAAGEADMHLFRRDVHIVNPRVVQAGTDDPAIPPLARRAAHRMGVFVAEIT
ncbi:MAG: nitroreductase family deazaflavin-dependent oxidoreductase [Mycobacterium sp.]|uniref:nitroreductase family deazaflavin-dependent oxidoreductase n=1 Tax=Mycobacterium sp. TaxID=1785 RepID=UPI003C4221DD